MRSLRPFVLARPRTSKERKRRNSRWGARMKGGHPWLHSFALQLKISRLVSAMSVPRRGQSTSRAPGPVWLGLLPSVYMQLALIFLLGFLVHINNALTLI